MGKRAGTASLNEGVIGQLIGGSNVSLLSQFIITYMLVAKWKQDIQNLHVELLHTCSYLPFFSSFALVLVMRPSTDSTLLRYIS